MAPKKRDVAYYERRIWRNQVWRDRWFNIIFIGGTLLVCASVLVALAVKGRSVSAAVSAGISTLGIVAWVGIMAWAILNVRKETFNIHINKLQEEPQSTAPTATFQPGDNTWAP